MLRQRQSAGKPSVGDLLRVTRRVDRVCRDVSHSST